MHGLKGLWVRVIATAAGAALVLAVGAAAASAKVWHVNSTADPGAGCSSSNCTLRAAVAAAASGDTVDVSPGTYNLTAGPIAVTSSISIVGQAATSVTIGAGGLSQIFLINAGSTVSITGVTITGGFKDGNGGAIRVDGALTLSRSTVQNSRANDFGGGIYSDGTLTVTDSTFSGNHAGTGGGIYNDAAGTLSVQGSTFTGNQAGGGGGLYDNGTAASQVINSTISGNTATQGGGIYDNNVTAGMTGTDLTIANNTARDGSNVFFNDLTAGGLQDTIVALPQGAGGNCFTPGGIPASLGHNLEDDGSVVAGGSCNFGPGPGDLVGVAPGLGALADNGGPTQTMALQIGSPAIDAGTGVASITTDQRGGPRPQPPGGSPDIGAYEYASVADTALAMTGAPNPVTLGKTVTYTLTATNDGPTGEPALAVQTVDTLPPTATLQSATPSQGTCSSASTSVSCQLGPLASGASATITIVVTPTTVGTITNSAAVSSSASDPNPANNQASAATVVDSAPIVFTDPAGGISQAGATLNGRVNPETESTTYYFQYGADTTYGSRVPAAGVVVGSDATLHSVAQSLTGLAPNRTYHYRVVATNATGTTFGADRSFTTLPAKPIVFTDGATGVSETGAALHGRVNPQDQSTTYSFQYGPDTTYGSQIPITALAVGSDDVNHSVAQSLAGLVPNRTYHYRVVATNATGTSAGADRTFRTLPVRPVAVTDPADGLSQTGAGLHGRVNPRDQATTYYFQYGRTVAYGSRTTSAGAGSGTSLTPVQAVLNGLSPATVYHYRVVAQNSSGLAMGRDRTFRTPDVASIHVSPARIRPGERLHIYGNAGTCPVGSTLTLLSKAFPDTNTYRGLGAIYTTVGAQGLFSTFVTVPSSLQGGSYPVSGRCGRFP